MQKLSMNTDESSDRKQILVNDTHSLLNPTLVADLIDASSSEQIQSLVQSAANKSLSLSVCGARHAMGGQQFSSNGILLDMSKYKKILALDTEKGIVSVEAGINWKDLIYGLKEMQAERKPDQTWVIAQKPTGADELTLGGSLAANVHGRGLTMKPLISDVEEFTLIDAQGRIRIVNRMTDPEMFSLAIGGYGLFGIISQIKLRLLPLCALQRHVVLAQSKDLAALFSKRIDDGYMYGDFQFAIDPEKSNFLTEGIFSSYLPLPPDTALSENPKKLSLKQWQELLYLAHFDKSKAYEKYKSHYLESDGQIYASDTNQLSTYIAGYHEQMDRQLHESMAKSGSVAELATDPKSSEPGSNRGTGPRSSPESSQAQFQQRTSNSEVIGELYVPLDCLHGFLKASAELLRSEQANVVYGTVRLICKDTESFLPWAKDDFACIIFNLHTEHNETGLEKTKICFRQLIRLALDLSGSFYLTYHRYALKTQIESSYPQFQQFLDLKMKHDPNLLFASDWWTHQKQLFQQ